MKLRWAICALVGIGLVASGCSSADQDPPPFDAVLIELFGTEDTDAYLMSAERDAAEFVVECMKDAGFEFQIPPLPNELDPIDPASLDDARVNGFGIVADYRHQVTEIDAQEYFGGDPNITYLSTLTADEIGRFVVTLDGPEAEPGQRKEERGCNGAASDVAYGPWVQFSEALPNYTAIGEERDTHPDWLAARAEWRDCMVDRGFDYAEPDAIRTTVTVRMRDTVAERFPDGQPPLVLADDGQFLIDPGVDTLLEELADFERAAAVANIECTEPLSDQFDAVERLVQQQFVDRNRQTIDRLLDELA